MVSYINCSAAVKAESDYICTSSNAVKIVNSIAKDKKILFAPDKNLGRHVMKQTGRNMLLWQGSCIVHETFSLKKLTLLKMENPDAVVIAHPECEEPLLAEASFIGSTTALLNYAINSEAKKFIVLTEAGIIHQMNKSAPEKTFIPAPPNANCACNECPYMRLNTLEKMIQALETMSPRLDLPEDLRLRALVPMQRMLDLSN